jgi:hypothetical protein
MVAATGAGADSAPVVEIAAVSAVTIAARGKSQSL